MWLRNHPTRRADLLGPIRLLGSVRLIATILHDRQRMGGHRQSVMDGERCVTGDSPSWIDSSSRPDL
jgi:hypothetical protein